MLNFSVCMSQFTGLCYKLSAHPQPILVHFKFNFNPTSSDSPAVFLPMLITDNSLVLSDGVSVTFKLLPELFSHCLLSHCSEAFLFSKLWLLEPLELEFKLQLLSRISFGRLWWDFCDSIMPLGPTRNNKSAENDII